ncbi:MAG: UDP-4-amino-4,6-dideoxy-N-acetyl-beta-L-altrosamine transaminase [Thermodesulfovibrionia bacterium]|nr:UDP-4-amino-4,6-dideoxy-N-acetyl-beta-L-altrosamine transaminase [Thermodesulfovibrionia bacterium]
MKPIPYGRQWIDHSDIQAVIEVLQSDWLTQGPKCREFESKFAEYCGSKYAVSVTSGTAALHLACLAAGIGKGDEVITSPITFSASSNCALYVGATPVFVDVDPKTICIDHQKFEEYLKKNAGKQPKAVIPVHFAGLPCNMDAIHRSAKQRDMVIIEDACHAHGARYASGEKVGSCKYSDMTVFSFHPLKNITTGEGGMITTNSVELYEKLLMIRTHGITKNKLQHDQVHEDYYYEMQMLGFNYRMNDIQSALGISQLEKLDSFLEKRNEIADYYHNELKDLEDYLILPPYNNGKHAWHIYVIQLKEANRDEVFKKLKKNRIGVQVHYIPVYFFPYYSRLGYSKGLCPNAEKYFSRAITIPLYPAMDISDMERVVREVHNVLRSSGSGNGQ